MIKNILLCITFGALGLFMFIAGLIAAIGGAI